MVILLSFLSIIRATDVATTRRELPTGRLGRGVISQGLKSARAGPTRGV